MKRCVLDASAAAAAFFQEPHAAAVGNILTSRVELLAPDLIVAEFANVIWKRHNRGEINDTEASGLLVDFQALPLRLTASADLARAALELALRTERTVYDCLYLTLAIWEKCALLTADKRFVNALAKTSLKDYVSWIGAIS